MLSERFWVAWSGCDGHHLQVPIMCRRRAPKCKVPLMYYCTCFKRNGQAEEKATKREKITAKFCTHPARKSFFYLPNTNRVRLFFKKCKHLFVHNQPKTQFSVFFEMFVFHFSCFLFLFLQHKKTKTKVHIFV